jgi:hypothetical protein
MSGNHFAKTEYVPRPSAWQDVYQTQEEEEEEEVLLPKCHNLVFEYEV